MFDPYHKWLGIAPGQRPPTHFQLLSVSENETDASVIDAAAIRQSAYIRNFQAGQYAEEASKVLTEIAEARNVLLDPLKRAAYAKTLVPKQIAPGKAVVVTPVAPQSTTPPTVARPAQSVRPQSYGAAPVVVRPIASRPTTAPVVVKPTVIPPADFGDEDKSKEPSAAVAAVVATQRSAAAMDDETEQRSRRWLFVLGAAVLLVIAGVFAWPALFDPPAKERPPAVDPAELKREQERRDAEFRQKLLRDAEAGRQSELEKQKAEQDAAAKKQAEAARKEQEEEAKREAARKAALKDSN